MTATLYASTDASAPQLPTSGLGGLYTIMKAVLIDGYGTRTPKGGWTIAFDDLVNKIVFKHATENMYYRVDDSLDYRFAEAKAFTAMTDIDTGTGEWPHPSLVTNKSLIGKRYSSTATMNLWHMLVDDSGNWFYFWTHDLNYPTGFFFGKLVNPSIVTPDWFLTNYDGTTISSSNYPSTLFTDGANDHHVQFDRYSLGKSEACIIQEAEEPMAQPSPLDGKLTFTTEYIRATIAPYVYYGRLPNRLKSWGGFSGILDAHDKIVIDTVKYIVLRQTTDVFLFEYDTDTL